MNNSTEDCAETDSDYLNTYNWWMECVVEIVIGLMGLIGNCIALPILHSKLMSSIFNKMLVFLTIFDNMFIICCVLEAIRKYIFTSNAQQLIFIYLLYQLQNIALTCSIYATVVLAVERYIAVSRPVEYHIMVNTSGSSPWRRVLAYMVPIILFGILFNLPKYFELKAILPERNNSDGSNGTNLVQFLPTELRLNEDYAFYYVHLTRFFITGILPFTSLLFLNYGIYRWVDQSWVPWLSNGLITRCSYLYWGSFEKHANRFLLKVCLCLLASNGTTFSQHATCRSIDQVTIRAWWM